MAGNCKPNVQGLGRECKYKVIDWKDYYSDKNRKPSICGAFDGIVSSDWHYENTLALYEKDSFLEMEIYDDCNIWRSGVGSAVADCSTLIIQKYENGKYVDTTNQIKQHSSNIGNTEWEKTIENLPKGRYKFTIPDANGKDRIDSEWYVESLNPTRYLIKSNNKYYNLKESAYDKTNKQYNSISIDNMDGKFLKDSCIDDLEMLTKEITIDSETFKPINKFKEFQIVTIDTEKINGKVNINGLKSNKQMIVANNDISKDIASHINYFKLYSNIGKDCEIKLIMSNDKGETWLTKKDNDLISINAKIPKKIFKELSKEEKKQWSDSLDLILADGININDLEKVDFNKLKNDDIRFAYAIKVKDSSSKCDIKKLEWSFDALGSMLILGKEDLDIEIFKNSIQVMPKKDVGLLKVNIITENGESKTTEKVEDFDLNSLPSFS